MSQLSINAYLAYLASSLQSAGSETTIYVDRITTLTGESIQTSDFSTFGRGTITIDPLSSTDIEFASFTGVDGNALSLTGATRGLSAKGNTSSTSRMPYHGVGTPVIISFGVHNLEDLKTYIDGLIAGTIGNASALVAGVTKLSTAPVSPTAPIAVGDNDVRVPTADPTTLFLTAVSMRGVVVPYSGRSSPIGWLLCDGAAVSRSTYSALFAVLAPSQTFTATSATPAVFTAVAHGLVAGDKIHFTGIVGGRGISTNTDYFVISAGLTADAFQISTTRAGSAVNTTGVESGTLYASNYGKGDGSTTFNVPDFRGFTPYGKKTGDANFDILNVPNTYVGEKTHVLTIAELAAHTHTQPVNLSAGGGNAAGFTGTGTVTLGGAPTGSTGSDTAHNNMSPYVVTNFIIKI